MRTLLNKHTYRVTWDKDFDGVIHGCATVSQRNVTEGAWLGDDMIKAYTRLHREGITHSVEVWDGDRPVSYTHLLVKTALSWLNFCLKRVTTCTAPFAARR